MENLNQILKPEQIKTDTENLSIYGKDWTTYFEPKPKAIVFPETTNDVVRLVEWARKNKVGLVPSGGRTGLSGGAVAINNEVVVSFERMNKILDFNPFENTVSIEPGVITEELQNFAVEKGLFYPVDFAARGSSQMGGNIATNAGGIKVIRYGMTRDWVLGLKVVTGQGQILDLNKSLIKNATGLDFRHLFIGSEGILGFVTEATLKLSRAPGESQVMLLAVPDLMQVMKIFGYLRNKLALTAFEFLSEPALKYVLDTTGLARPFDASSPYYLVLEYELNGSDSLDECFSHLFEMGWVVDGALSQTAEQFKNFWRYRENISESLAPRSPYKNDIAVRTSKVPDLIKDLDLVFSKNYPTWEVIWFGHIGDGNLHINILRPLGMNKEDFVKECRRVDEYIFESVAKHDGTVSAEHGVGLTKKDFLKFTRSEDEIQLMREIKKIFDPDGIINPGKVI